MIAFDLANLIRDRIASDIAVDSIDKNHAVIYMPFVFDDGDQCSIFLERDEKNTWNLSDDGDVFKRASEIGMNFNKDNNKERLQKLTDFYGVEQNNGALELLADEASLGDSIFTLTQTCLEATWLAKTPKKREQKPKRDFSSKFEKLVSRAIPKLGLKFNWHDNIHDEKGYYPVDCRIPGGGKQLFLFGVPNPLACMRATITCQHYRIAGAEFHAVAIYDHEENLPKKPADQLNDVVDKRFPRIQENKQIESYIRRYAQAS